LEFNGIVFDTLLQEISGMVTDDLLSPSSSTSTTAGTKHAITQKQLQQHNKTSCHIARITQNKVPSGTHETVAYCHSLLLLLHAFHAQFTLSCTTEHKQQTATNRNSRMHPYFVSSVLNLSTLLFSNKFTTTTQIHHPLHNQQGQHNINKLWVLAAPLLISTPFKLFSN
jgi:hypothetical protein